MPFSDNISKPDGMWTLTDQKQAAKVLLDTLTRQLGEDGITQGIEYLEPYSVDRAIESGEIMTSNGVNTNLIPDHATPDIREDSLVDAIAEMTQTYVDGIASVAYVLYPEDDLHTIMERVFEKLLDKLDPDKIPSSQARVLEKMKDDDYLSS